jgi:hypothetical protein
MADTIAGVGLPDTSVVAEVTEFLRERTNPLIFHHSRRVFLSGSLHARTFKDRPDTAYGTLNADVLQHFVPGFRRGSTVERVLGAPWPR